MPMIAARHVRAGSTVRIDNQRFRVVEGLPSGASIDTWVLKLDRAETLGFRSTSLTPDITLRVPPDSFAPYLRCARDVLIEVLR